MASLEAKAKEWALCKAPRRRAEAKVSPLAPARSLERPLANPLRGSPSGSTCAAPLAYEAAFESDWRPIELPSGTERAGGLTGRLETCCCAGSRRICAGFSSGDSLSKPPPGGICPILLIAKEAGFGVLAYCWSAAYTRKPTSEQSDIIPNSLVFRGLIGRIWLFERSERWVPKQSLVAGKGELQGVFELIDLAKSGKRIGTGTGHSLVNAISKLN